MNLENVKKALIYNFVNFFVTFVSLDIEIEPLSFTRDVPVLVLVSFHGSLDFFFLILNDYIGCENKYFFFFFTSKTYKK